MHLPEYDPFLNNASHLASSGNGRQCAGRPDLGLDRFCTNQRRDVRGLLLGFAAFDETRIQQAVKVLSSAFATKRSQATI